MSSEKINEGLSEAFGKWTEDVEKKLSKRPERKPEFVNTSGIPVKRVYTPLDHSDDDYLSEISLPGEYPYTRGVQPTMYRGRHWTMRMYAGFATAEESNRRYKFLLDQGQTGLSVAFDLPTQIGYDSDSEMSIGEVGKVGVAIDSLRDMETLFDGIGKTVSSELLLHLAGGIKHPSEYRVNLTLRVLLEEYIRNMIIAVHQPAV